MSGAVQWTGTNDREVKDFLGAYFDKIRGGLSADDRRVVWFRSDAPGSTTVWSRVYPSQWIVLVPGSDGRSRHLVVSDEQYRYSVTEERND